MSGGPASAEGAGVGGADGTVPRAPLGPQPATATVNMATANANIGGGLVGSWFGLQRGG